VYLIAAAGKAIPVISLVMIAAIYGIQALVFVLRRKWDMVGWMIFYIIAIPAFSFFLPLYSFWRMDDFSWGQTRIVLGESGKKVVVHVSTLSRLLVFKMADDGVIYRMKASLILVLSRSSHGVNMYVLSGIFYFWLIP